MKLLFISTKDVHLTSNGGFQGTNRNYLSMCDLLGAENVEVINLTADLNDSLTSRIPKWINYALGFWSGLSRKALKRIREKSRVNDFIFIDSSQYGVIAHDLKKSGYQGKIICFCHNVEYHICLEKFKINRLNFWKVILVYYNEKKALKYSDQVIALNNRDRGKLEEIYGLKDILLIPNSFVDALDGKPYSAEEKELTSIPPTLLFIGHNWYPTTEGLRWFIDNVLDHVNVKLQIAGNGMDVLKDKFVHPKIEFLGYVEDISKIIRNADCMISPIFKGSGMKVKTCEALMYGKNIIATKEAFEGYEIEYDKVGALCDTSEEFICALNSYTSARKEKFNKFSREYFLEKYSFKVTLKKFEEILKN